MQDHPDALALNSSHVIHKFRFGKEYPGRVNPLENMVRIDRKATGVDKYFIKVVPVTHISLWGRERLGEEYSVTEYYQSLPPGSVIMPGVYFLYDIWPIRVILKVQRLGLIHLLVRLCAVCGGVWTVTGIVNRSIHSIARVIVGSQAGTASRKSSL